MRPKSKKNGTEKERTLQHTTNLENTEKEKLPNIQHMPDFKVILVCAVCCGIVHMYHVSSMFENYQQFSNLSNLERELTFHSEMGLYYSYYKNIIEARSFISGYNSLLHNNKTEYPQIINTVQRFNLYPELVLGGTYRMFSTVIEHFEIELPKVCWKVDRGKGFDDVISCEGIGDPFHWYLNGVWLSAGITAVLIFIHGCQLSYSLAGGFLAVSCFFFNHAEATSVQWAPLMRENFAFPWSIALNIIATRAMRINHKSWVVPFIYGTVSIKYLLCWQMSQYTLVFHIIIAYGMYAVRMIPALPMLLLLLGGVYAFLNNVVLQFGNSMLFASPLAGLLIGILLLYIFIEPLIQHLPFPMNIALQLASIFISSYACKIEMCQFFSLEDESHVVNMLKAKFSNYSDFHTLLYKCSPEFDFLPRETWYKLSDTLLLPIVILILACVLSNTLGLIQYNFAKRLRETVRVTNIWEGMDCGVIFNIFLLCCYGLMGSMVMKFKLFLIPQMCVVTSLLASKRYWGHIMSRKVQLAALICIVGAMGLQGSKNILKQRSVMEEYANPSQDNLEQLIHWVNRETGRNAVFAGPMPTMASIMLSTGRHVVNHPHYENAALRERTKSVYSIFSRRSADQVYETLLSLKVNYVVLKSSWCFESKKRECSLLSIWDKVEPKKGQKPSLCVKLIKDTPLPFSKIFQNDDYAVLEIPSKYIEIPPPRMLSE